MYQGSSLRQLGVGLAAIVAALCLLLVVTAGTLAATVNVYDQASVFQNKTPIYNEAKSLPYPIDIYTTNAFNGSKAQFDQRATGHIDSANKIVIAIDTGQRHLAIVGGRSVSLSSGQYNDAVSAFTSNFNGDYTTATVAAIRSLRNSVGSTGSGGVLPVGTGSGNGLGFGTLCCIGLLVLAAIAFFSFMRRRRGGGMNRGRGYNPNLNQPNQPYNQPYPPNYGPGYPGPNQGQGVNPLAAGGLGAAAGGLLGYELGRQQGQGNQGEQGGNVGGNDFGGGASGDFGRRRRRRFRWSGGSGDFGGGGSGENSGGGSSGNF